MASNDPSKVIKKKKRKEELSELEKKFREDETPLKKKKKKEEAVERNKTDEDSTPKSSPTKDVPQCLKFKLSNSKMVSTDRKPKASKLRKEGEDSIKKEGKAKDSHSRDKERSKDKDRRKHSENKKSSSSNDSKKLSKKVKRKKEEKEREKKKSKSEKENSRSSKPSQDESGWFAGGSDSEDSGDENPQPRPASATKITMATVMKDILSCSSSAQLSKYLQLFSQKTQKPQRVQRLVAEHKVEVNQLIAFLVKSLGDGLSSPLLKHALAILINLAKHEETATLLSGNLDLGQNLASLLCQPSVWVTDEFEALMLALTLLENVTLTAPQSSPLPSHTLQALVHCLASQILKDYKVIKRIIDELDDLADQQKKFQQKVLQKCRHYEIL